MYDMGILKNVDSDKGLTRRKKRNALHQEVPELKIREEKPHRAVVNNIPMLPFPFFQGIKQTVVDTINERMIHQKFRKREYVYLPYEKSDHIFFVKSGNIEIGYLDESGRELSLDILGPGEIFGSVIGRSLNGSFARAVGNVTLAILNKDDFDEFLEKYPRFSLQMLKMMSERIQVLEVKLQHIVFSDVKTRICKLLQSLLAKAGDPRTGQIRIALTHQDIANLVASSRETASLHLSQLKKAGAISYERKRIRILSMPILKAAIAE